jgi:hypothetical protein
MVETYFSAVTVISDSPPESFAEEASVASAAAARSAKPVSDKRLTKVIDFHRAERRRWQVRAATV